MSYGLAAQVLIVRSRASRLSLRVSRHPSWRSSERALRAKAIPCARTPEREPININADRGHVDRVASAAHLALLHLNLSRLPGSINCIEALGGQLPQHSGILELRTGNVQIELVILPAGSQ